MARRSRPRRGRDQPRHRFRSRPTDPGKQAAGVIKRLQGSRVKSVGTARSYQERLVQIAARLDVALTALTPAQVRAVAARQDARNALATEIALASGIGAHELLTLGRPAEQPPDDRRDRSHLTGTAAEGMKFAGRDGVIYTVVGKGGLVREVLLPHRLAERLEARRLNAPAHVVDRGVRYRQRYDIGGGQAFSASFSRASMAALGKSRGAHSLRHRYVRRQ